MNSLRREEIKRYIERKGIVSLKELAVVFSSVSLMTIHRDLDFLEDEGTIIRMRGGATYVGEYGAREMAFDQRAIENKEAKESIAKKAASFVKTGSSIFLDADVYKRQMFSQVLDQLVVSRYQNETLSSLGISPEESASILQAAAQGEVVQTGKDQMENFFCLLYTSGKHGGKLHHR